MEAIGYFLLWAAVIYFMMRFGCGAHVSGHGHGHGKRGQTGHGAAGQAPSHADDLRWVAPAHDIDPVCGKTVSTEKAKSAIHDGMVYYFCSRDCREMFEAAPDQYLVTKAKHPTQTLEAGHV